ncbi:MAG: PH domain-containing protein [Verrucomicrobiales bacterium]
MTAELDPPTEGRRLHPRGLIIGFITGLPQLIVPIAAAIFSAGSNENPAFIPVVIVAVMSAGLFFRWLIWRRTHYYVGEDDIRVERGIISRAARSIPYDRIQDVSVEQKLLARLLGLGEVKFETGSGEGEDATLRFVSLEEAGRLRETVRAAKAGTVAPSGAIEAAPETDDPPVFAMNAKRLLILGFYSSSLVFFAILGALAEKFNFLLDFDWLFIRQWIGMAEQKGLGITPFDRIVQIVGGMTVLLGLVAIAVATGITRTFIKDYGFRLDRTAKGFRRRRGLLTLTDVVMPVARVQAAVIATGPVRQRSGWHALTFISLASDGREESDHVVAPLATLDEIRPIVKEAGIAPPEADASFRKSRFAWWAIRLVYLLAGLPIAMWAAMTFADAPFHRAGWLLLVPVAFLPIFWLKWRHYGDRVDDRQLYVRENWWWQRLVIAPQVHVQSIEISQGPLARALGLSTLHFGIAGGTLRFAAVPLPEARAIRDRVMAVVAPVDFSQMNRRG